jgi:hypothetical protein
MTPVAVAFKAHLGWLNCVAVDASAKAPQPLAAERIQLIDSDDREASEPYHVAGGWHGLERAPRPADPAAVIRRGRRKQIRLARMRLGEYRDALAGDDRNWVRGVVLTGRGRLVDDLEDVLGSHAQIHVAEGEAIRDAARAALDALGITRADVDEKRILGEAAALLGVSEGDCDALMREARPAQARHWTREERLLALGAWLG